MKLNIDTLQQVGSFTGRPVEKEITWRQGSEHLTATVYVRPLGYQSAVSDVLAAAGHQDSIAGRIAAAICNEEGQPIFTAMDITHGPLDKAELAKDPKSTKRLGALDGNLTVSLLTAIHEVNNLGKTTSSPTSTNSGTSSSSPASGAAPSRKRKKT
ncbi:phage tail assembly chaperone family protein, TAC [Pseudomonas putida]|uniref:phage tail assembly chaperone family protein, TAC n=1 Tax=Pseudomonas putida TaxID=303 RepID=UPI0018D7696B|nr:phage tail assembly chaperone family protein, TAC [Pseudomonas putida]MBH3460273.1 phage tail assembly chaperone family protein, TAC [Pseudomonas putida]